VCDALKYEGGSGVRLRQPLYRPFRCGSGKLKAKQSACHCCSAATMELVLQRSGVTAPFARCFCIFRFLGELSTAVFFTPTFFSTSARRHMTRRNHGRRALFEQGRCAKGRFSLHVFPFCTPLTLLPPPPQLKQQPLFLCVEQSAILLISRRFAPREQSKCSIFLSHSRSHCSNLEYIRGRDANGDKGTRCYCLEIRHVNLFLTLR
jgi:hypothetical protein